MSPKLYFFSVSKNQRISKDKATHDDIVHSINSYQSKHGDWPAAYPDGPPPAPTPAPAPAANSHLVTTSKSIEKEAEREFTLFGKLPTELRLMVWRFASQETRRIVRIIKNTSPRTHPLVFLISIPSPENVPLVPLLTACHESREEVIKTYTKKMFGHTEPGISEFDGVLFNPDNDVLMIDLYTTATLEHYSKSDLLELQYLAIYDQKLQYTSRDNTHYDIEVARMGELYKRLVWNRESPKLKWIYLVLDDEKPGDFHYSPSNPGFTRQWFIEMTVLSEELQKFEWGSGDDTDEAGEEGPDWVGLLPAKFHVKYFSELKVEMGILV